jgi:hypothetical protein
MGLFCAYGPQAGSRARRRQSRPAHRGLRGFRIQAQQAGCKPLVSHRENTPRSGRSAQATAAWLVQERAVEVTFRRPEAVAHILREKHYLLDSQRGIAWDDQYGVIIVSACPSSRRLPQAWFELSRWCITSEIDNAGSRQWRGFVKELRRLRPDLTTIVSYSDPAQGHTGALYRACNWWWAPTWQRLRPPPSGNGSWNGTKQSTVKDRWIFALRKDPRRAAVLELSDASILKAKPWARYKEPGGADFAAFQRTQYKHCSKCGLGEGEWMACEDPDCGELR